VSDTPVSMNSNRLQPGQETQQNTDLQRLNEGIEAAQLRYHHHRVAVTKEFTFDAAHHLHMYEGKCKRLHGHTYRLVVTVSGLLNSIGMVMDFGDLKSVVQKRIEQRLDHAYLNEALPPMNTTAENMVVWMWEELQAGLAEFQKAEENGASDGQDLRLEQLTLNETPTSSATLKREWMEE